MTNKRLWLGGAIVTIFTTVMAAWIIGVPSMVIAEMDEHNDLRYVSQEQNAQQLYELGSQKFNERMDTLQWREINSRTPEEKELLRHQQRRLEREQRLHDKKYGK